MQYTKTVARILYFLSNLLALGYLVTVLYAVFCIVAGIATMPFSEGKFLKIFYPFTERPFLIVDNNLPYILFSFSLPLFLYGVFFGLSARVFAVFFQPKLFTRENVAELRRFYLFNILLPLPLTTMATFYVPVESIIWGLVVIHFILGTFAYFMAAIFSQGVQLQKEQDLFI